MRVTDEEVRSLLEQFSGNAPSLRDRYLIQLPTTYQVAGDEHVPLVVYLHGPGESGLDPALLARQALPLYFEQRQDLPFILVSPLHAPNEFFTLDLIHQVIDDVLANYRVDRRRISLTGISTGAIMCWNVAFENPERYSALAPVSGAPYFEDPRELSRLKDLPVWAFHRSEDPLMPFDRTELAVTALLTAGGNARFTILPPVEHPPIGAYQPDEIPLDRAFWPAHEVWDEAYNETSLLQWLMEQQRPSPCP